MTRHSVMLVMRLKKATGKMGADGIIETSGSMQALQSALKGVAYNGTIAYAAFAKPFPAGLWLGQEGHFNQAKLYFPEPAQSHCQNIQDGQERELKMWYGIC